MGQRKDEISAGIIAAMKAKDKTRLNVLRYLKKLLIENDTAKKPIDEMDVIISYAKKIKDSLAVYPEDSPQVPEIKAEIVILNEFLPQALTQDEVAQIIQDIKAKLETPNMGVIMKELSPQIKGRFDGKLASQMVKDAL